MKTMNKKNIVILLVILTTILLIKQIFPLIKTAPLENAQNSELIIEPTQTPVTPTQAISKQKKYTFTVETDGVTAFDLLQSSTDVEYDQYDFGVFIKSIDGLAGNDEFFWAFLVNDEMAQEGADKIILNKGDVVTFEYREINQVTFDE